MGYCSVDVNTSMSGGRIANVPNFGKEMVLVAVAWNLSWRETTHRGSKNLVSFSYRRPFAMQSFTRRLALLGDVRNRIKEKVSSQR